jgi:hypothetical protein
MSISLIFLICVITTIPGLTINTFAVPGIDIFSSMPGFEWSDSGTVFFMVWCFDDNLQNSKDIYTCDYIPLNQNFSENLVGTHLLLWLPNLFVFSQNTILSINLTFLLASFLAGLFTYLYIRLISKNPFYAFIGAGILCASNYLAFVKIAAHLDHILIFGLPMLMYSVEKYISKNDVKFIGLISVSCFILILSELQVAYISFIFVTTYVLFRSRKNLVNFLLGVTFGVLLSLPFQINSILSLAEGNFALRQFQEQLFYDIFSVLFGPYGMGIPLLLMIAFALLSQNKIKYFFSSWFLISLFLSFSSYFYMIPYYLLPLFNYFRGPFRFLLLNVFSLSVMVSLSLSYLDSRFRKYRKTIFTVFIFLLVYQTQKYDLSFVTFYNPEFLDAEIDGLSILEYPVHINFMESLGDNTSFMKTAFYEYFVTIHRNKLMNSYVEYGSPEYESLLQLASVLQIEPNEENLVNICDVEVNAIICHNCSSDFIGFLNDSGTVMSYEKELIVGKVFNSLRVLNLTLGESYFFVDLC